MIDAKKEENFGAKRNAKRDTKVDVNMVATLDEKVDAIEVNVKLIQNET